MDLRAFPGKRSADRGPNRFQSGEGQAKTPRALLPPCARSRGMDPRAEAGKAPRVRQGRGDTSVEGSTLACGWR